MPERAIIQVSKPAMKKNIQTNMKFIQISVLPYFDCTSSSNDRTYASYTSTCAGQCNQNSDFCYYLNCDLRREAIRGEDLLLLTHSSTSEEAKVEGGRAGQGATALLALVDKVESEKELDGSRKLVAYATVCLAGT